MNDQPTPEELTRKLERLRARDISSLGHQAKLRHQRRIDKMEQAYQDAFAAAGSEPRTSDPEAQAMGPSAPRSPSPSSSSSQSSS